MKPRNGNQRGIVYVVWGSAAKVRTALLRSIASIEPTNPGLPYHVVELGPSIDPVAGLLEKYRAFEASPFQETLLLDCDTYILGSLAFGFQRAAQHGLACCINECPWLRRYGSQYGDMIEYNTGVVFFTRKAARAFRHWGELARTLPSRIRFLHEGAVREMSHNDQLSFALALEKAGLNPYALPMNWNYRPLWHGTHFGPIKVWHDYSEPNAEVFSNARAYGDTEKIIEIH